MKNQKSSDNDVEKTKSLIEKVTRKKFTDYLETFKKLIKFIPERG